MGFYIYDMLNRSNKDWDEYFTIALSREYYDSTGAFSSIDLPIVKCKAGRFFGLNKTAETFGLTYDAFCPPDDFQFNISGTPSAGFSNYISINLYFC